jgi:hypothetical protein
MSDVLMTVIVTAENVELARRLALLLSPTGGQGFVSAAYGPPGAAEPTHWVSYGWMDEQFFGVMNNVTALYTLARYLGDPVTPQECAKLVAESVVTLDYAGEAFAELGVVPLVELAG